MNRTRMILLGLFALILSVVVTFFIYRTLSERLDLQPRESGIIVVAKVPLSNGMLLKEEDVTTAPWPNEIKLEGSFTEPEKLVGRGVLFPVQPNEPILESKLAPEGSGAGLAPSIPEGMRAVAIKVDNVSGVAGFVLPGSRVDVILSGSPEGKQIDYARAILENVQVLSAGQDVTYDAQGKAKTVPVVTLLLTPEEAQKLTLATVDGRIQLVLRNPLDQDVVNPNPVRRQTLYAQVSTEAPLRAEVAKPAVTRRRPPPPPPPVILPPKPKVVEVELIEGDNRKTLKFQKEAEAAEDSSGPSPN